jgi:hypothetical protein
MGNFINGCVILIFMVIFAQTGPKLDGTASRNIIMLQFAVAAAVSVFMTLWRWFKLKESEVWKVERSDAVDITEHIEHRQVGGGPGPLASGAHGQAGRGHVRPVSRNRCRACWGELARTAAARFRPRTPARPRCQASFIYKTALRRFGPRLFVTCGAWVVNDVAFYVGGRAGRGGCVGWPRVRRSQRYRSPQHFALNSWLPPLPRNRAPPATGQQAVPEHLHRRPLPQGHAL